MSLRERQPYMEESERLKHLHARQYPTYKVKFHLDIFRRFRLVFFFSVQLSVSTTKT